jgi:hypothetical protein
LRLRHALEDQRFRAAGGRDVRAGAVPVNFKVFGRVVTDSNTMIPPPLAAALENTVVPLTVAIDGDELVEDASIDLPAAYRRPRAGETGDR